MALRCNTLLAVCRSSADLSDSATIFSSRRHAVIQLATVRIVFLRSLVFIIVVMMFAERGPTKSRHDFVEKQIKKDHSAYSSTRQITTERNIRRRTDLEVLPDASSPRSEKGRARTRSTPNRGRTVEFDEWVHVSENCS
jgi:hypothetical protein